MTKRKKYKPKGTSVPMLVSRQLNETEETLKENTMLLAFRSGHAMPMHFDRLTLMTNIMEVANQTKKSEKAYCLTNSLKTATVSIKNRYDRTGKLGLSGEEIGMLKQCLIDYDNYWKLQTTSFYNQCVYEVNEFYAEIRKKRA